MYAIVNKKQIMAEISIESGDITLLSVDAIINAANTRLIPGTGVDGAIHKAAGPKLWDACMHIGGCETGQAVITPAFNLKAKYVIHTPSPVIEQENSEELLSDCYKNSLILAQKNNIQTIAFPLIGAGFGGGFSADTASKIAVSAIKEFIKENPNEFTIIKIIAFKKDFEAALHRAISN